MTSVNIVMCTSEKCPYRDTCYRKRAEPKERQDYYNYEYTCNEDSGFNSYIQYRESQYEIE